MQIFDAPPIFDTLLNLQSLLLVNENLNSVENREILQLEDNRENLGI